MKPMTAVEIVLSYISLGWAYVLFTSPDLFESSASWNQIELLASSEWVIGTIALVCALTKIIGIAMGAKRIRWVGLIMSAVFWIAIASAFLIADGKLEFTTGFIVYSGIAVMALWTSKEVKNNDGAV